MIDAIRKNSSATDLPPPGTDRSVAWSQVTFGPGLPSSQTLGTLVDGAVELATRTLYIQCDTVQDGQAPAIFNGVTTVPLYPTVVIDFGAHGRRQRQLIDCPPGAQIRVPIVCTDLRVTANLYKAWPTAPVLDWLTYNNPPASQLGAPITGLNFSMSGYAVEGHAGENRGPLIRKLTASAAAAGTQFFPTALGAYKVRLIGDPTLLTFFLREVRTGGATANYGGAIPAMSPPTEIPSGACFVAVVATGATNFELEYYLAI